MGLARQDVRAQPDLSQELHHPLFPFGPAHGGVDGKGLTDNVGDGLFRVERRIRVLEDHLHRFAVPSERRAAQGGDVLAIDDDRAPGRVDETDHQPGQGGLSRSALAHETQGPPGVDPQGHLVDRSHRPGHPPQHPAAQREILDQVAHLEDRGHGLDRRCRLTHGALCRRAVESGRRSGQGQLILPDTASEGHGGSTLARRVGGRASRQALADGHWSLRTRHQRIGAPWSKTTAAWELVRTRHHAGNGVQRLALRAELRDRVEQRFGVRVPGTGEEIRGRPLLDDLSGIHHDHVVSHVGDHTEVVRHEDHRHVLFTLERVQQAR